MHTSRLFCCTVTNNIFSAKSSIDAAVSLISSPTCSWWLPSSSSIAGNAMSLKNQSVIIKGTHIQIAHMPEVETCNPQAASQISPPMWQKQLSYSPLLLFSYRRPAWWDRRISWGLPQPELSLVNRNGEFEDSKWFYHSLHAAHWRTFVPIPIMAEQHQEQNKTWIHHQPHYVKKRQTHHIAWIWSCTSFTFAFSCIKDSTSWSSCSPPASKPGESWKVNSGLLLKENSTWTLWIPR